MRLPDSIEFRACARCGLCNSPTTGNYTPVAGEGPEPAPIMFIGQAPGKVEQRVGRPFQGPAGAQLDAVIVEAGLTRDDIYIANMVKQRPDDGGKDRAPTFAEIMACKLWLDEEIARVNPQVIVLFGGTAQQLAFPGTKPHQAQGCWRSLNNRLWGATYHPAYILHKRDPAIREMLVAVVKQAKEFVK